MTDYIRRLVSGNKARFKDGKLNLELDLVYVTDQVIIMGYPASGIEGFYRNRREDAQKFLSHRHGKDFWVYNFCPVKENSYPASVFEGRVSRYPFPDHHAPPLALLPLAAREMRAWLQGSTDRVIVLHCKAGKGRSGTLACAYLLSLDDSPAPPRLERNYTAKQWAHVRADELMQSMPTDDTAEDLSDKKLDASPSDLSKESEMLPKSPVAESPADIATPKPIRASIPPPTTSLSGPLKDVLDLHTSRRMKTSSSPDPNAKVKQGVSIHSQRRWLYYWSLLLTQQGPADFWPLNPHPDAPRPKVRITQIRVRMREVSGMKMNIVRAANLMMDRRSSGSSGKADDKGHVWVSLARYDDQLVETLERLERRTRDEGGHMGRRKGESGSGEEEELNELFLDDKWDKWKMVSSFARMGTLTDSAVYMESTEKDGKVTVYTLNALSGDNWETIRDEERSADDPSETNSLEDSTQAPDSEMGVLVDANREVRVKLYIGQVFMGWVWFIPTFHMPSSSSGPIKFILSRKEIDFPLGFGAALLDVEITLSSCSVTEQDIVVQSPTRQTSQESKEEGGKGAEPAATLQAVAISASLREVVEEKQVAEVGL